MAASPSAADGANLPPQEKWASMNEHGHDGRHGPGDDNRGGQDRENVEYAQSNGGDTGAGGDKADSSYRGGEKQVKLNKVYIGGLPEHTRREDLQSCFGKIGNIVNIELKVGYGFVEFESREAAEESVAKYHEGYFMGNKIRVELSHGGGRTAKYSGDPGACFKCGNVGHWARECPNATSTGYRGHDAPPGDRGRRDYPPPPPPPRDYPPFRDEFSRYPPRDRFGYDYPPPPPGRDFRRPPSPPRDYRDFPPPVRAREYDDYRARGPPGPPPPPPPARYEARPAPYYAPDSPPPPGYPPRGYPPPPVREPYERYERRPPPPPPVSERYAPYPPPAPVRVRTPPGVPPRGREEYDRPPVRDFPPVAPPPPAGGVTPPRYADYPPPRNGNPEVPPPRYRRRSQSPPPRSAAGTAGYEYPPHPAAGDRFASNGYSGNGGGPPLSAPPRGGPGAREYLPPRNGRDEPGGGYRRS